MSGGRAIQIALLYAALIGLHAPAHAGWLQNAISRVRSKATPAPASTSKRPAEAIKKIWIFETEYSGELATRKALAHAYPEAQVVMLKEPLDQNLENVFSENFGKTQLAADEFPDLIIHSLMRAGEQDMLLEIKKLSRGKTFLTIFDDPKARHAEFDLIVNPSHMDSVVNSGNVIRPVGMPSSVDAASLEAAAEKWNDYFENLPRPIIALMIGGQTKDRVFAQSVARELGVKIRGLVKSVGGSLLVTNSRRTPEKAFSAFLDEITGFPVYIHDVKSEDAGGENPYQAYLAHADYIVVTGESSSMISDAAATGKPVYVFAPNSIMEDRHKKFVLDQYNAGRVRLLEDKLEDWSYRPLSTAAEIKSAIERKRSCEGKLSR